jgi:hypothetical protein
VYSIFSTFTQDRSSVFTPWWSGRSASMINRPLQVNSRYVEHEASRGFGQAARHACSDAVQGS